MVKSCMSKVVMQRCKNMCQGGNECLQKQGSLSIFYAHALRESVYHSEIFYDNCHQSFFSNIISKCKHIPFLALKRIILRPLIRTPKLHHFSTRFIILGPWDSPLIISCVPDRSFWICLLYASAIWTPTLRFPPDSFSTNRASSKSVAVEGSIVNKHKSLRSLLLSISSLPKNMHNMN